MRLLDKGIAVGQCPEREVFQQKTLKNVAQCGVVRHAYASFRAKVRELSIDRQKSQLMLAYDSALAATRRFLGRHWKHAALHLRRPPAPVLLATPHRGRRPRQPSLQRLARPTDRKRPGARPLSRAPIQQRPFRFFAAPPLELFRILDRRKSCRLALRADFLLGCLRARQRRRRRFAMDPHAVHRDTRVRLRLQHGLHELLRLARDSGPSRWLSSGPSPGWEGKEADWIVAVLVLIVAWLAHPIGCLWAIATIAYIAMRNRLKGWRKLAVPGGAVALLLAFRLYLHHRAELAADWNSGLPFWQSNGADQLMVYGDRYETLAWVALAFGVVCLLIEVVRNLQKSFLVERHRSARRAVSCVLFRGRDFSRKLSRLHVCRLDWLARVAPNGHLRHSWPRRPSPGRSCGSGPSLASSPSARPTSFCSASAHTRGLGDLEASAEAAVATLPPETRIIPTLRADAELARRVRLPRRRPRLHPPLLRLLQLRAVFGAIPRPRLQRRHLIVTDSADDADDMQGGSYEIEQKDLPVKQLYQCDRADWTKLCLHDLKEGETTGP